MVRRAFAPILARQGVEIACRGVGFANCSGVRFEGMSKVMERSDDATEVQIPTGPAVCILGLQILDLGYREGLELVRSLIDAPGTQVVHFIHCHGLLAATKLAGGVDALGSADLVFGDGTGMRWAARARGVQLRGNLNGTDMVPDLLAQPPGERRGIFLLGGQDEDTARARATLAERYPEWEFRGHHHGFLDDSTSLDAIAAANASGAELVLVGMGTPLQETWIARHRERFEASLVLAVGGLFGHYSGTVKRAPVWLRRIGMEWVAIPLQDPSKLRRYTLGTWTFLWKMMRSRSRDRAALGR